MPSLRDWFLNSVGGELQCGSRISQMQRKIFWLLFLTLGLVLDFTLPIVLGQLLTFPLIILCWWIAFRSGWFE